MPCPDENTLLDFIGGRLPAAEREAINAHVDGCADCRAVLGEEQTEADVKRLQDMTTDPRPRPDRTRAVRRPQKPKPQREEDELIGTPVGQYQVESRIGGGGMGIVYRAKHPLIGKVVAIKVLRPEVATDPEHMRRMLLEARAVNAIGHESIVDIFGFGALSDGRQYMVMEHLTGEPLDAFLDREPNLSWPFIFRVLEEICAGVSAAHGAGLVHRDLKPSNLFVVSADERAPQLKLLDFGIAKQLNADKTTGAAVGTPAYMAPEQIHMRAPVTAQSDLYSLGIVAYELATGRLPFPSATDTTSVITAHLDHKAEPLSTYRPDAPPAFVELLNDLLQKNPKRRPASAEEVRLRLASMRAVVEAEQSPTAPTPIVPPAPLQRSRRRSTLRLALLASVALVASGLGIALLVTRDTKPSAPPVDASQKEIVKARQVIATPPPDTSEKDPPDTSKKDQQLVADSDDEREPLVKTAPVAEEARSDKDRSRKTVAVKSGPTLAQLRSRAAALRRELSKRSSSAEDVDKSALAFIQEAEANAAAAKTDAERRRVAAMFDEIERKYLR